MKTLFHLPLLALLGVFLASAALNANPRAPATTPALPPEEAVKRIKVPDGFEVRLFASEPDVINPVAMTWDERGRLWVVELFEYPKGAAPGTKPRDKVKILEDTDADGRADKVTVFADGLNLATGILLGDGGAYVGQAPHLLFLKDTDGDDVADEKEVVLTGFGKHDTHELLNGFTWGPDGWLYMTHGVFTHSKVHEPGADGDDGIVMNAAVARVNPDTRKFEIFADGTSNPWGVDFDKHGHAFISACVIDHMFHMAPAGLYTRQGGAPKYPYSYELLPSIVDHRHHRAAYAGVQVYQGDQYPKEYIDTIFCGNIHANAVHQDILTPKGSSFVSSFKQDFLVSEDGWFRPVSTQVGPDGALWVMDWYDKFPCYQNAQADPEGVDRTYGRVWRVVHVGDTPGKAVPSRPEVDMDLGKLSTEKLVETVTHPNIWHRRMAQRMLSEREGPEAQAPLHNEILWVREQPVRNRLAALWTLHNAKLLGSQTLNKLADEAEPALRMWSARLTGERQKTEGLAMERLAKLAADKDPNVRLAVATALRQFVSSQLTVNRPPAEEVRDADVLPVLKTLIEASKDDEEDRTLAFVTWMALEPRLTAEPEKATAMLGEVAKEAQPFSNRLVYKSLRRLADTRSRENMTLAMETLTDLADQPALLASGLQGLLDGQKAGAVLPSEGTADFFKVLRESGNSRILELSKQLGTLWGDSGAVAELMKAVLDPGAAKERRLEAIETIRSLGSPAARPGLIKLLGMSKDPEELTATVRALGDIGGDEVGDALVSAWKTLPPSARVAAADVLTSREAYIGTLLDAVEAEAIHRGELPIPVLRGLYEHRNKALVERATEVIGSFRRANEDTRRLIAEKRQVVLEGPIDFVKGRQLAEATCLTCHKFHGRGVEVGPDLTGVGRSTLNALLSNVLDPNQIIGKGYENVIVTTKDNRAVAGRVVEESDNHIKLLVIGGKEEVISKDDIATKTVTEMSVMPQGFEHLPDDQFRNLIWYILAPPEDGREFDAELRAQLAEVKTQSYEKAPNVDWESVSLWNPDWRVFNPEFEGAPQLLPEYLDRKNVLKTHPVSESEPAYLERVISIPATAKKARLEFAVASHDQGDWELGALVNGEPVLNELVRKGDPRWQTYSLDLGKYAGQTVYVRLENRANNWNWEFGHWDKIKLVLE